MNYQSPQTRMVNRLCDALDRASREDVYNILKEVDGDEFTPTEWEQIALKTLLVFANTRKEDQDPF